MGFLSILFKKEDALTRDARRIYAKVMAQSRQADFYGRTRMADTYDGRIDVLTLHMAAILTAMNTHGSNGEKLGQALFDEMKDDFEIALREEALSDAGVKKRITPMISLFYDRVKAYAKVLHEGGRKSDLVPVLSESLSEEAADFASPLAAYLVDFYTRLKPMRLGEIALAEFSFPNLP